MTTPPLPSIDYHPNCKAYGMIYYPLNLRIPALVSTYTHSPQHSFAKYTSSDLK